MSCRSHCSIARGKPSNRRDEPGSYSQPALSPDGKRVAVIGPDPKREQTHVWVYDVATGKGTPITSDAAPNTSPVWSRDGREIAYVANQSEVYRKASDGSGKEELLYKHTPGTAVFLTDWSAEAGLCFWVGEVVYELPLDGDRKPITLFSGSGARGGRFSPDGRYVAYSSNQSGRFEVYLAPVKNPGQKQQVSKDGALGGIFWREDGKELYFMALVGFAPTGVMAVDLTPGPELQAGIPRLLFPPTGVNSPAQLSSIATRDGERFVFLAAPPAPAR